MMPLVTWSALGLAAGLIGGRPGERKWEGALPAAGAIQARSVRLGQVGLRVAIIQFAQASPVVHRSRASIARRAARPLRTSSAPLGRPKADYVSLSRD